MTYTCEVCHGTNHSSRLHCQYCGAIPARYSLTGKATIHVLPGCQRTESVRTSKARLVTVPLDYYASSE